MAQPSRPELRAWEGRDHRTQLLAQNSMETFIAEGQSRQPTPPGLGGRRAWSGASSTSTQISASPKTFGESPYLSDSQFPHLYDRLMMMSLKPHW